MATDHEAQLDKLKAKVNAADDLDEKFYFVQRAAGDSIAQNAPGLIARLQEAGAISAQEAAGLFTRLLSAATAEPPAAAPPIQQQQQQPSQQPLPGRPAPPQAQEPLPTEPREVRQGQAPAALPSRSSSVPPPSSSPMSARPTEATQPPAQPHGGGRSSGGDETAGAAALESRHEVLARAVELGMDVRVDRSFLWLAAEALDAPLPEGWEVRHDALGQPYYLEVSSQQSCREHPSNSAYRTRFFALKRERVGYRELMLSRVTSTHLFDALAALPEAEARRLETLYEHHDRDKDGVVSFAEFAVLAEEASGRQGTKPFSQSKLRAIFVAADLNNDGFVDFNEFCRAQLKRSSTRRERGSRSRRDSPTASVAGSSVADDTPRSWPNASPRTWPTPPITPRDTLDSPSTMCVARRSTPSMAHTLRGPRGPRPPWPSTSAVWPSTRPPCLRGPPDPRRPARFGVLRSASECSGVLRRASACFGVLRRASECF